MSKDYQAAADWAEHDMQLQPASDTALRGHAAANFGRDVVARALGRQPLDPTKPGEHSPRRQVRLPQTISDQVDAVAAASGRSPSAVMRDAIAEYVGRTPAAGH